MDSVLSGYPATLARRRFDGQSRCWRHARGLWAEGKAIVLSSSLCYSSSPSSPPPPSPSSSSLSPSSSSLSPSPCSSSCSSSSPSPSSSFPPPPQSKMSADVWEHIRSLDITENWTERTSVIAKADHLTYTDWARVRFHFQYRTKKYCTNHMSVHVACLSG